MEKIPTYLPVVAGAIGPNPGPDGIERWLMHRRPRHKAHGGLWEFPGGKVEPGESLRDALVREIAEECGLVLDPSAMSQAGFAADEPGTGEGARPILLLLFRCETWRGEPVAHEGGEWDWFTPDEIASLPMPPLDRVLVGQLFVTNGD